MAIAGLLEPGSVRTFFRGNSGNVSDASKRSGGEESSIEWVARPEGVKSAAAKRRDEHLGVYSSKTPSSLSYRNFINMLMELFSSVVPFGKRNVGQKAVDAYKTESGRTLLIREFEVKVKERFNNNETLASALSYIPYEIFTPYAYCVCADLLQKINDAKDEPNRSVGQTEINEVIARIVDLAVEHLSEADRLINAEFQKYPGLEPTNSDSAQLIQVIVGNPASAAERVREFNDAVAVCSSYHRAFFGEGAKTIPLQSPAFSNKYSAEAVNYQLMDLGTGASAPIQLPIKGECILGQKERSAIASNLQEYISDAEQRQLGVETTGVDSSRSKEKDIKHLFRGMGDASPIALSGETPESRLHDFQTKVEVNFGSLFATEEERKIAGDCIKALAQQGAIGAAMVISDDVAGSFENGHYFVTPGGSCKGEYTVVNGSKPGEYYMVTQLANRNQGGDAFGITGQISGQPTRARVNGEIEAEDGNTYQFGGVAENLVVLKLVFDEGSPIPQVDCVYAASKFKALGKTIFGSLTLNGNGDAGQIALPECGEWEATTEGLHNVEKSLASRLLSVGASGRMHSDREVFDTDIHRARFQFESKDGIKKIIHCAVTRQTKDDAVVEYEQQICGYFPHWSLEEKALLVDIFKTLTNQSGLGAVMRTNEGEFGSTFSGTDFALTLRGLSEFTVTPGDTDDELVLTTTLQVTEAKDAIMLDADGLKQLFTSDPSFSISGGWSGRIKLDFSKDRRNPVIKCERLNGNWSVVRDRA